ncbi:discoidin domain-containing protein [Formosa sp. PL04]|uniref:galactose-binding domain-containing protein n=1 Tax=Formosa sp. PL04 TaxID=3081755 RepID=UPI00298138BD|nr:discoidin domain-containing protein [Formosa sp. PL04]MDW5290821.1 discoidin domain-containing protein [Formosa sp. PL04]
MKKITLIPHALFKSKLLSGMKKLIPLCLLIIVTETAFAQSSWLEGSWGVTYPVYGGTRMDFEIETNNYDYVAGSQEIADELPTVGHIITNLTNFAKSDHFTLSANANVDVVNEIHPSIVPNAANDEVIFDVLQNFKNSGKKVILYISTSYFERASDEVQAAWVAYYTNNFGGNEYAAYEDLIEGFIENVKDYADGYWLDTVYKLADDSQIDNFAAMIRATDPGCIIGINQGNTYFTDNGSNILVASDGTGDSDLTPYKIVKHKTSTGDSDFTSGHVTPIGQGAPVNSWGYEEFTIPEMIANPWAPLNGKQCLSHGWFPTRERWHSANLPLVFDLEQAYRFVRRITDGGTAITFANTTDYRSPNAGHMMPDEMVIMKEINRRLLMTPMMDYVPYTRPAGAYFVGETAPNYYQHIDFQKLANLEVGEADYTPKATASSGYNISFSSSNTAVATIVNGNIHIVAPGTSTITASQAGNSIYAAAGNITQQLTVIGGGSINTNLALNGTATQSTTLSNAAASRAIDDNTNGVFNAGSVTASIGPDAWWEVDLGDEYTINDINLFNRTDACCTSRLANFTVSVINSNGTITYSQTITTTPTPSVTIDANGVLGQTIRVQSNLTSTLNLAEVQVYGTEATKVDQTITFNPFPSKEVGDADFDPGVTASSGLAVTYSSLNTNVATIVNGQIHIVSEGTSYITATQTGNDNYNAAPNASRVLTVTASTLTPTNLALNGTASQSSTASSGDASRAIDGDTNGVYSAGSVTHTSPITNSYWQVDLSANNTIGDIVIYNRTDACCTERLSDFTVLVIDDEGNFNFTQRITTTPNPSVIINAGDVQGKIIRIRSNIANSPLSLAEVEVFGTGLNSSQQKSASKNETLSISNNTDIETKFLVYPNPVSDIITIDFKSSNTAKMQIIDYLGKTVISDEIQNGTKSIDLSHLSSGLYFIKVSNQQETFTRKIIKK